ncbi:MAG: hypothetical protein IJL02_09965 [Methanobrevibacter sp.]|uniref:hypothetical protein n=1 Tax=Methanobrevibacter sp. TaxID=66852 RepID=UPI0025D17F52|nr:hypothetical protein [Methanobrevibacter sp.]MBQ6100167.1 hypothetical protein [Methanobrevibacter sp.]
MNTLEKIKNSWWVILSFIMFLNGFGFIYIGTKHYNKNWILEGIIYELPWFIYFVIYANYGAPIGFNITATLVFIALILLFISIIRSIWVAVKLADVYDNNEKYTISSTVLKNHNAPKENTDSKSKFGCCICLVIIFIIFMIIAL